MHLSKQPAYHAEISNHDGQILVVIFGPARLFSRRFRKICDAERWLTALARRGLTERTVSQLNDEGQVITAMPPLGAIAVKDTRVRKQAILPSVFS